MSKHELMILLVEKTILVGFNLFGCKWL